MTAAPAPSWGLTARVLFYLSIALVPLGVVGLLQNQQIETEAERRAQLSLLAMTEQAVSGEKLLIQQTFGAAQALGDMYVLLEDSPEDCISFMQQFLRSNTQFVYAGFMDREGMVYCSSAGVTLDLSDSPTLPSLLSDPRSLVDIVMDGPGSRQDVVVVSDPLYRGGDLLGYISISLPLEDVGLSEDFLGSPDPRSLVTFNAGGDVLSSEQPRERAMALLPDGVDLREFVGYSNQTFLAESVEGKDQLYAVVTIVPGVVYALATWSADRVVENGLASGLRASLPILMWLLSVAVTWLVIERFVISPIRRLSRVMSGFASNRHLPGSEFEQGAAEFVQLDQSFRHLADDIMRDEAELEDQLRQKTVLLKEVHHRVKNNLQIVSSMMNMQMRKAKSPETKTALGQVRDRIMGLSGVHRTIYQAESLTQVNAAALITQIIDQTGTMGQSQTRSIAIKRTLEDVVLFPDQAVSVAMWVAETLTNAIKYAGSDDAVIEVELALDEDRNAHLEVRNTRSHRKEDQLVKDEQSTGLGQQLIKAFALQLNGESKIEVTETSYVVTLDFPVEDFRPDPVDY